MSPDLLVALVAALIAGTVSGTTGFGLALTGTPLLLFVYEPRAVVFLIAVISVFISAAVVLDSWRSAHTRLAFALLTPSIVGVVAGAELLRLVDPDVIRLAVGVVVVFSALLLVRDIRLPGAGTRWGPVVAGSASGALSTSTGLAAPPIVLLLASRDLPKHDFRSTSALYFLFMSIVGIAVLFGRGLVETSYVPLAAAIVPVSLVGKSLGTALLERTPEKEFRIMTLGIVILTGALGAVTALLALV